MTANRLRAAWRLALCSVVLSPAAFVCAQEKSAENSTNGIGSLEGQRVAAIRIVAESGGASIAEIPSDFPLQPGQAYSSEAVRASLRQLFRTGDYADLRAEVNVTPGGLRLDFVVQKNLYVNQIHITGLREPPSDNLAIASMRLRLGEPFRESDLKDALERLRGTLREDGLYQPQWTYDLNPRTETQQMDITVHVDPGARARLGAIAIGNQSPFTDAELLRRSKLKPGQSLTSIALTHATDRVRKFLVGKGHLGARVVIHRGDFDSKNGTVPLDLETVAGPEVHVEVAGVKIPAKDLRRIVPVYEEGSVDADLLQEGRRNIRDYQERLGYFDAQVEYELSLSTPEAGNAKHLVQVIKYQVERGKRQRLEGVSFEGNRYFSADLLRGRLTLQPAAFDRPGRFSRRLLSDDATSIQTLYDSNGFASVKVSPELLEDYQGKKGNLFVKFHIEEGPQTLVGDLKLEGNHALSEETLRNVIGSTSGQPYSDFTVSADRDNILALYFNEGFPDARFTAAAENVAGASTASPSVPAADSTPASASANGAIAPRVRLTYQITEGTQVRVARLLVDGAEHTRSGVIDREIQIHADGPLREGEVVDTQRRLYNLGIFTRVSVAPQNPAGSDPEKTMVVLVEEAKRYTIGYGGGFEVQRIGGADPASGVFQASPRGIFEISKANLTGRADTLGFKVRASTLQYRALISYSAQNYFGRPEFSLQLTGFADKTRDVNTFTSTRYEGSLQLAQRVTPITSLLYRFTFRKVLVDASSLRISPQQIPLLSQPTLVSEFGGTWFRERRDNPADATRGDFNTADFNVAGRSIGSSANFTRLFLQNSSYYPLGRKTVFARSIRFGWQKPFGSTRAVDIPLPERFFGGGGNSLRGFGLNQAGPRDPQTGFPIGGLGMVVLNQELRFPLNLPKLGNKVGGAVFYDMGNVFSSVSRMTLRWSPSAFSVSSGDLAYFSHTIGFGIRYATPIGPVRLDLAYQLNPPQFAFLDSANMPQTARLPRFQFFFNLGSVF